MSGKATLRPGGSSSTGVVIEVREHGLYKLKGKFMDHGKEKQDQIQIPEKQVHV